MNEIYWGHTGRLATRESVLNCVNDGWHPILNKLIDDLFAAGWDGTCYQVKEKFGVLRFYIGESNQEISDLIDKAEQATGHTCDICGAPGKTLKRTNGWLMTRCDEHTSL